MAKGILWQIKSMILFAAFYMLAFGCFHYAYAEDIHQTKNVLILNSYHQGLIWTKDETNGIIHSLMKKNKNISVLVEYMDWKHYPTQDNLKYLYQYYKYKYQKIKLDIIITTDDEALKFALSNRENIFSNAPIIFCGVNQSGVNDILQGYDRVTGVVEVVDPTTTIKGAMQINPSLKNIYLMYDNSESGISTGNIVVSKIKALYPDLKIIPLNNMAYEEVLKKVRHLSMNSIIFITTYYSDVNKKILDIKYVTRNVSENSSVPVYHLFDFGINNGAIGGGCLSGKRQGKKAGALALRVLNEENINDIPVTSPKCIRMVFDYNQMQRFGIKSAPENWIIINKPFSFYQTYKALVIGVTAVFLILLLFMGILLSYIRRIKRMKKNLSDQNEELTQLYEELTASDEEMKEQYNEIISNNEKIRLGEEQIAYLALHDVLTGLPNKLSLFEKSKKVLLPEKGNVALIVIDIDNFKYVNDTMGHIFGDKLIIKVSERLSSLLDDSDTVYRHGGDEFIIMLEDVPDIKEVELFAARILSSFTEEFEILNTMLCVSLSFGIVMFPEHGSNIEQLLKYADMAMYHAKDAGRKNFMVYDQLMNDAFTERANIEKYLLKALDNDEFDVYYQPQFDLKTKNITGFEALLRWNSPELGMVSPNKFINVAEDTQFIIPLGTWVLRKACMFLKRLNNLGFHKLTAAVNISIIQFLQQDFYDIIEDTLTKMRLAPENLELEITESVLIESFESVVPQLDKLSKKKVRIALDDFGKGYSSLYYLKQLPINTLKLDKSFIDDITNLQRETITGQIIYFGKWLGMDIIAEGVEFKEQIDYLKEHKCDKVQGFLLSKPITEDEFIHLLQTN